MFGIRIRSRRAIIATAVLGLSVLGGSIFAGKSHAAYTVCITDPVVSLSDGSTITMYAQISDDISDVQSVAYELHVPAGVYPTGMTYDQYGYLETVDIVDDQQPAAYSIGFTVTTGTAGLKYQGNATVAGITCKYPPQQQISYSDGPALWLYFGC